MEWLFDEPEAGERPSAEHEPAHDLLIGHAADRRATRVDGHRTMVAHDEQAAFGNLVRQLDVQFALGFFFDVGFVEQHPVNVHIALVIDIDPLARARDHALDQNLVVVIERDDITGLAIVAANRHDDVLVMQRIGHGTARYLQDGQDERDDDDGGSRYDDEREDGGTQYAEERGALTFFRQLFAQLRFARQLRIVLDVRSRFGIVEFLCQDCLSHPLMFFRRNLFEVFLHGALFDFVQLFLIYEASSMHKGGPALFEIADLLVFVIQALF